MFAFFVLLFSMATLDPVKYSAFQNAQADQTGGIGEDKGEGSPIKSQIEIKEELENLAANLEDELKEKMKKDVEDSDMDERLKKEKIKIFFGHSKKLPRVILFWCSHPIHCSTFFKGSKKLFSNCV